MGTPSPTAAVLVQLRSRPKDKAAAVAALGALARSGSLVLPVLLPKDLATLHKLAHDSTKKDLWDDAAAVLALAVCCILKTDGVSGKNRDAACQLLRKHAFQLGFEGRDSAQLAPAVPLLIALLQAEDAATGVMGKREAAGSLMNLAWKSSEHAGAMVDGMRALIALLQNSAETATLENAAGAVLNILSHGDATANAIAIEAGIVSAVTTTLLAAGKNKWNRFAAKILGCLPSPTRNQSDAAAICVAVLAAGTLGPLCELATAPASSDAARETQCCVLRALGGIAHAEHAAGPEGGRVLREDQLPRLAARLAFQGTLEALVGHIAPTTKPDLRAAAAACLEGIAASPKATVGTSGAIFDCFLADVQLILY